MTKTLNYEAVSVSRTDDGSQITLRVSSGVRVGLEEIVHGDAFFWNDLSFVVWYTNLEEYLLDDFAGEVYELPSGWLTELNDAGSVTAYHVGDCAPYYSDLD